MWRRCTEPKHQTLEEDSEEILHTEEVQITRKGGVTSVKR